MATSVSATDGVSRVPPNLRQYPEPHNSRNYTEELIRIRDGEGVQAALKYIREESALAHALDYPPPGSLKAALDLAKSLTDQLEALDPDSDGVQEIVTGIHKVWAARGLIGLRVFRHQDEFTTWQAENAYFLAYDKLHQR